MKPIERQNERLLMFADHLNSIKKFPHELFDETELVELEENIRIHFKVKFNYFILEELREVFPKFDSEVEDLDQEEGIIPGVFDFFGLTPEQFCHLFDVEGFQNIEKYGGRILTEDSKPADFAFNIIEMVKRRK